MDWVENLLGKKMPPMAFCLALYLLLSMPTIVSAQPEYPPWTQVTSPTNRLLESVHFLNENCGYIVGIMRTVLKWDGTSWSIVTIPDTVADEYTTFTDVFCLAENDVWIIGYQYVKGEAAIIHWDGTSWSKVTSPVNKWLYSIYMVSPSDGWIVGADGTILRWSGSSWNTVPSPTSANLTSVYMLNQDDGWIVGENEGDPMAGAVALHWDGSSWRKYYVQYAPVLYSVFMLSHNDVWAVGLWFIYHWDGTAWTRSLDTRPIYEVNLRDIYMVGQSEGWIVCVGKPHIFHWNGVTLTPVWSIEPLGGAEAQYKGLYSIYMLNSTDGWTVGDWILRHHITDNDGDGMSDDWEKANGLDPNNPNDGEVDSDGDGLSNFREYIVGSNPNNRDSDGDGVNDGVEVNRGANPLDPEDYPPPVGGYIINPVNTPIHKSYITAIAILGILYALLRRREK